MPDVTEVRDEQPMAPPADQAGSHHGTIAGVPYDTRPPTMNRFKWTYWSAENPRLFPPKVTGLGWGINFYWLLHLAGWFRLRKTNKARQ
jgi:hypothetical protein